MKHCNLYILFSLACPLIIGATPEQATYFQAHTLHSASPHVTVIGTGYVGLVTGAGLAHLGNTVTCADIDTDKIESLQKGGIPIYEPGLYDIVSPVVAQKKLTFTNDVPSAIRHADVIFIAVGTPMDDSGKADMSYVANVVETIAQELTTYKIICTKSTVPVGTGTWIRTLLESKGIQSDLFDVVSNPEFLREGSAVGDFLKADRVVIGVESEKAATIMKHLYKGLFDKGSSCVLTNIPTSETIKYASNAFLATKLSFINEMANFCDATGADSATVSYAMGLDHRIEAQFLHPGPGYGGSCFPKDTQALVLIGNQHGVDFKVVQAAIQANTQQKNIAVKKLLDLMNNNVSEKTIAVLGLAFKANTDDIRYSSSIATIQQLLDKGAYIKTYDPEAMDNMRQLFPHITYCDSTLQALQDADAVLIMTEWNEFKNIDIAKLTSLVKNRVIIDTRNILDTSELKKHGFAFDCIGRSYTRNQ